MRVEDVLRVAVRVEDMIGVLVRVEDVLRVAVRVENALRVAVRVEDALGVLVRVEDALRVAVRVEDALGVLVRVEDDVENTLRVLVCVNFMLVVSERDGYCVSVCRRVAICDRVIASVREIVREHDGDCMLDSVNEIERSGERDELPDMDEEDENEIEGVTDKLTMAERVDVRVVVREDRGEFV